MYQAYEAFALLLVFFEFWYGWLLGFHYDERRIKKIRHVSHRFQTRYIQFIQQLLHMRNFHHK